MKLGKFAEKHAPQEIGIGKKLLGKGEQIAGNACHNSFAAGTPVLMADGTEKAIGAVRVGDVVEATDVATGLTEGHVVTKVIVGKGVRQMADVTVAGETIHATANHWFFTENRGWVKAGELQAGDVLRSADGTLSTVERVQAYTLVFTTVLNLEVEGLHDFYVGDPGVLVHNSGCGNLKVGEVGSYGELSARGKVGDKISPHHMPQAKQGFSDYRKGGSIAMDEADHKLTRTYGRAGADVYAREKNLPFRNVLARDIWDLRQFGDKYRQGSRDMIRWYRRHHPNLIDRRR
jgi:hypothetical protein